MVRATQQKIRGINWKYTFLISTAQVFAGGGFKMQQSGSSVLTVSCRGDFIECSPSKNTSFSARHNPSPPCVLQSARLLSLLFLFTFFVFLFEPPSHFNLYPLHVRFSFSYLFPLFWHCLSSSVCVSSFEDNLSPISPPARRSQANRVSADKRALSGSMSAFIFTFLRVSLCVFIAICLSVFLMLWGTWLSV